MGVYEETARYILGDRSGDFKDLLKRINLKEIDDDEVDEYFILTLKLCVFHQASSCVKILYRHFEEEFMIEETEIPYFIYLMGEIEDASIFVFLHRYAAKHFTYEEIVDIMIMYFKEDKIGLVIDKCEQIFGRQNLYFYREMYRRSVEDISNPDVAKSLSKFLKTEEVYADYPPWTFPQKEVGYIEDVEIPKDVEFDVKINNLEEVTKMILEFSDLEGGDYEKEKRRILDILYVTPEPEIEDFVREQFKILLSVELASNEQLFYIYGPSHPISDPLHEVEKRFGGSRMFLSLEKQFAHEDFDETVERYENRIFTHLSWFTGNCHWCFRKIRRWRHALRMPAPEGGWKGCYCSSGCITEAIIESNIESYYLLQLWAVIYEDIKRFGIHDFMEEPVIEIEEPELPKDVSYYHISETEIKAGEIILFENYDDLADIINDYPEYYIYVLFADDKTSRGIIEAFVSEKDKLTDINDRIFIMFTVVDDSEIDDTDPPELSLYHNEELVRSIVDFNDYEEDIGSFLLKKD